MPMTEKCDKDDRGYPRRSYEGLFPLTKEVRRIVSPVLGTRGFAQADILESWNDIVGSDLAQGIIPEKLSFDKDKRTNGTLYVKSAGGAFAMLFEHQKQRVLERINAFFGYPAVGRIKIQQGALKLTVKPVIPERPLTIVEEQNLMARVAEIDDDDLRRKAYEIGKAILQKK